MSANDAAHYMHRRLHCGDARLNSLKKLSDLSSDAPQSLRHATPPPCEACTEAKATRLPHSTELYKPSHPGRLIHVDVTGHFLPSADGGRRYALSRHR
eukprot:718575-Pleurochrysis_carterae.AAC.1